jgi:LEA14-like dessication related protein
VYYVNNEKKLLQNFTYKIVGVQFSSITLENVSANLSIRFNNTADVEVEVNKFYVDFYINNVNVGYFQDEGAFTVTAHDSVDIPVSVSFNPSIIFQNVVDMAIFSSGINDVSISAHGFAQIASSFIQATIPIDYDSTIKQIMSS